MIYVYTSMQLVCVEELNAMPVHQITRMVNVDGMIREIGIKSGDSHAPAGRRNGSLMSITSTPGSTLIQYCSSTS